MERVIFWDFDGTLAFRRGMWSGCLVETLDQHEPEHSVVVDDVRPFLRDGFPWHTPQSPHPELSSPEAWWQLVEGILARAYECVGFGVDRAAELAQLAHSRYIDPELGWEVFEDTIPTLAELRGLGWRHMVLSNHVPELPDIVKGLGGLDQLLGEVFTSAATGYEKPHPEAFALALRACGAPPDRTWMVGDNFQADVDGACAAGINAILVRNQHPEAETCAADLREAALLIESTVRMGRT